MFSSWPFLHQEKIVNIYDHLLRDASFANFLKIQYFCETFYNSLKISFPFVKDNHLIIACPRDLDLNKHICEMIRLNTSGLVTFITNAKMETVEDLKRNIFYFYFKFGVLSNIIFPRFVFLLRPVRKEPKTLMTLGFYQMSTLELQFCRNLEIVV